MHAVSFLRGLPQVEPILIDSHPPLRCVQATEVGIIIGDGDYGRRPFALFGRENLEHAKIDIEPKFEAAGCLIALKPIPDELLKDSQMLTRFQSSLRETIRLARRHMYNKLYGPKDLSTVLREWREAREHEDQKTRNPLTI